MNNDELYNLWATIAHDIQIQSCVKATQTSADYVLENMSFARYFLGSQLSGFGGDIEGRDKLLRYGLEKAVPNGLIMEFGVYSGSSINLIADSTSSQCHGFDCFTGLPEDWKGDSLKGKFTRGGQLPDVRPNVELHAGLFEDTLGPFLEKAPGHVTLLHIDSDLYSSAVTVLEACRTRLVKGSVIVFDEYFNYPGWEKHEAKAWQEFVEKYQIKYEYLGYAARHYSIAVRLIEDASTI